MALCRLCRRPLKDAESIRRGYGPKCYAKTFGQPSGLGPQGRRRNGKAGSDTQQRLPLE